jgi:hypothetical protein
LYKPKFEGSPSHFRVGHPRPASTAASMLPRTGQELGQRPWAIPGRPGCPPSAAVRGCPGQGRSQRMSSLRADGV